MSAAGSASRCKSKRQRNTVACEDLQSVILRRIYQNNEISPDDVIELYHINKPFCQGCRQNSKDSPNCFCGLIPPPGGSRKHGLWQKSSEIQAELGPDPSETLRPSLNSPSGLTNLGATCYVNSVLQCLYRIKPFIRGFLAAEADLVQRQYVLRELALLFGQLHSGKTKAVDSAPLADVLELNNSIQQDGQEFLKLLLTSLERLLGLSKNPQARSVVQDVFRGTLSHATRCSKCGQESDASKQLVDFYELELNVKGLTSLEESLDDYLSEEQLLGENQFFCESCNTRVDATHCSKLRSLPPILNFQLKRFVFDAKTATKKKVTSKFSFPQSFDMRSRLSIDGVNETNPQEPLLYDLSAILIHRGSTANSGHYVANIRDDGTGQWWEFDDELVTSLGFHPLGEVTKTAKKDTNPKETQLRPGKPHGCCQQELSGDAHALQGSEITVYNEAPETNNSCLMSADAYMLIYNLREPSGNCRNCILSNSSLGQTSKDKETTVFNIEDRGDLLLPDYLHYEIEERNEDLLEKCTKYKLKMEKELSNIADRRHEVTSTLAEAPVQSEADTFFWISSNWLRAWADDLVPFPIDNTHLLCEHGKVSMTKVSSMKRISEGAWTKLHDKYGGGPAMSGGDYCAECIMENARATASASSFRDQRMKVRQMLEDAFATADLDGEGYFVSKTWLQNWLRRKSSDAPIDADAFPTAAITCPHDDLLPDNAPGAKRQPVPEEIWNYFLQIAAQVKDNSSNGCLSFTLDTPTCSFCEAEMMQAATQQQDLRAIKMEERQKHGVLFSGESITVVPGVNYYLVPSAWLAQWRSYLGGSGKRSNKADEPPGLEGIIRSLLCQKHERLLFRPPKLERNRRGELFQGTPNEGTFTIVSDDDWGNLCERWDVNPSRSIRAIVEPLRQCHITNGKEDTALQETVLDIGSEGWQENSCIPCLLTKPEVCNECIEEREHLELRQKLQYVNEEIYVDLVCGKEPPKSVLESSMGERRVSKRPRRGSASTNRRVVLKVSGDTTVYQLKLLIWESFAVVKENQRVHFGTQELNDDLATLANLSILPGAHLWVMDTGLHENRDIADELSMQEVGPMVMEEGFSGTLLARLPTLAESFTVNGADAFCRLDGDDVPPQFCQENVAHGRDDKNGKHRLKFTQTNTVADMQNISPSSLTRVGEEQGHMQLDQGERERVAENHIEPIVSSEAGTERCLEKLTLNVGDQQGHIVDVNSWSSSQLSSTRSLKALISNGEEMDQRRFSPV